MNLSMHKKWICSLAACAIGVFLIGFAMHAMDKINAAKGIFSSIGGHFSGNPAGKVLGGAVGNMLSKYDTDVQICLIAGIILAVGGAAFAYYYRKHR